MAVDQRYLKNLTSKLKGLHLQPQKKNEKLLSIADISRLIQSMELFQFMIPKHLSRSA